MAIGTFKLITRIDNSKAKGDAKEFDKIVDDAAKKAADSGKDTVVDIDVKKAKKEIETLEKEIDKYEAKLSKLESGKLADYNAERAATTASTKEMMSKTTTPEQKAAVQQMHDQQMEGIDKKYAKVLAEADEYGSILNKNDERIKELKADLDRAAESERHIGDNVDNTATSTSKQKAFFDGLVASMRKAPPLTQQLKNGGNAFTNAIIKGAYIIDTPMRKLQAGFETAKAKLPELWANIRSGAENAKNHFALMGQKLKQAFHDPKGTLQNLVASAKAKLPGIATGLNAGLGKAVAGAKYLAAGGIKAVGRGLLSAARGAGGLALKLGGAAVAGAGKLALKIGSGVVNGLKKATTGAIKLGKHLGSKLSNGLKSAVTRLKDMGKQTASLRKKFTKIGIALLGMRGAMGALRQIISSVLSNNEQLQNQLTAVKGVFGQALAPAMNILVQGLSQMVSFADKLYQIFTGTSLVAKYNAQQTKKQADAAADAAESAKEANDAQLGSFDVANKFSDSNSNSSSSSDDTAKLFEATNINSWLQSIIDQMKNGDWKGVGESIANGINDAVAKINWSSVQQKVNTFCSDLGESVNGFVGALDWGAVGNTVGEGINTITNGINTLVDKIKWESVGSGLATGMNGIVEKIDGEGLGKTLSANLKIITDTLYGFFNGDGKNEGFNFTNFGTKIGETVNGWFNNIDWSKAGSNITSAISGLGDTLAGAADQIDWGGIKQSIEDFFAGMDWSTAVSKMMSGLGKALGGIASVIAGLICDAFGNIKNYFDDQIDAAGGNVIEGVFNGIVNWLKDVGTWLYNNVFMPFIDGFKSTFSIHSPSKDATLLEMGSNIIEGIFNGIINWLKDIKQWFEDNVFNKITDAWDGMKELTLSIAGNVKESFNKLKDKWDSVKEKGKNALATIKGKAAESFTKAKKKWEAIKSKKPLATIKGKLTDGFKKAKSKWDALKSKKPLSTVKGKLHSTFTSAKSNWDGIKSKAVEVTTSLKDGITSAISGILTSLCNMVNKVIGVLNKIPGISISTITPPKLAKGAVVNNPGRGTTVTVGEAGPEGVIPLNDTVLSKIAAMIAEHGSGGVNQIVVPVYLSGREISRETIQINKQMAFETNKGGAY